MRPVRRLAPVLLLVVAAAVLVLALPALLLAAPASLVLDGRYRAVRLVRFAVAWAALESWAVAACLAIWLGSPIGGRVCGERFWNRHYEVLRRYVAGLYHAAEQQFTLCVQVDGAWAATDAEPRPVIVLSRHSGAGDSLLLVHHLLSEYRRRPRLVMKAFLQLDPCIGIAARRLPNVFVRAAGEGMADEIGRLAAGLGPRDALVIFPEGGNFTERRRHRAIRRLRRLRRGREADRAAKLANVLPPRPGGTLAAIDAAPGADVVFVAHSGLEDLDSVSSVWRNIPLTRVVRAHWWRIPAESVPRDRGAQVEWLYTQWEQVDAWIEERRPVLPVV